MPKVTSKIFNPQSLEDATVSLGLHLPQGRAWAVGVEGSNVNSLCAGSARAFQIVQELIESLAREYDVNQTVDLIDKWEESVGIPDRCLFRSDSLEERRTQVIQRLRKRPIVTIGEMQKIVDDLFPNSGITLVAGTDFFSYEYEYESTYIGDINEKFVLVAVVPFANEYEYDYEYEYTGAPDVSKLQCVLERIIPANSVLFIEFTTAGA